MSKVAVLRLAFAKPFGSGNSFTALRLRIDARDRVLPALGDPGRAVRPDDHAVRRRALAERDLLDLAGLRIEDAERALALRRVPDGAVRRGRDVVRMRAARRLEIGDADVGMRAPNTIASAAIAATMRIMVVSPNVAGFAPVALIRQLRGCAARRQRSAAAVVGLPCLDPARRRPRVLTCFQNGARVLR